jgi:hypothetical protein
MKYEVTHKSGKKEILEQEELPRFSSNFNRMVRNLKIDEKMYDITSMTEIKRIE